MELRQIGYGMAAGFSVLVAVAVLQWFAVRETLRVAAAGAAEGDISGQVWQVLAEARSILEESA